MKKLLLLISFIYVSNSGFGSHLMGGQITAQQVSGLTYYVNLTIYRDTIGINVALNETVNFRNISNGNIFTASASHNGPVFLLNGVQEYTYPFIVTFPVDGVYEITWSNCCRNNAILNCSSPGSMSMMLLSILTVPPVAANSSPVFLNPPVVLAQVNDTFYYNPLPFDVDGDSIAWSVDTPINSYQQGLMNYVTGYVTPSANSGGPFTMNPITGEITWIPSTLGHFVASFIIEEFRNGVKIGEIRRDMQYIVVDVPGNTDKAILNTTGWPVDPNGNFSFDIDVNSPFTLNVDVSDAGGDSLYVEANGEPFLLQNNPAIWTNTNSAPGISENEFYWNTTLNEARINPYVVAFRIFETHGNYTLVKDKTVLFKVGDFTSVNENTDNLIWNIYPNPTSGEIFIKVNVEKSSELKLIFINQLGQEVKKVDKKINTGQNLIYLNDLNLSEGIYFLNIMIDGKEQVKKLVVKK